MTENNVIDLQKVNSEEQKLREVQQEIQTLRREIEEDEIKVKELKKGDTEFEIEESTSDGKRKKEIQLQRKELAAHIKDLKAGIDLKEKKLQRIEVEFGKIRKEKQIAFVKTNSEENAKKVFEDNNIHYVIFDQQWWSVDPGAGRMDLKINSSETNVIKDLIFDDSGWEIQNEQELKRIAKELGRFYKHIVRDFNTHKRPGIYNQMETIRSQWLKPIYDVKPHECFRLLTLSIAGGDEDYADQLEKFVAYRYCHPEDVMVPNIDSCAVGGTGRETFYNLISTIFTNECCGTVGEETFKGTHNGDLFGKMFVKVDEKNTNNIPIEKVKELTGALRYRHRQMNKDARDVDRLFSILFFRNGFTSTAKLAGTGTSGEDRRFEPIIARVNLTRHVAKHFGLIQDINTVLTTEQEIAMSIFIKEWQKEYYKSEKHIAEWLGYIIQKHNAQIMTELIPLHGTYYDQMLERQKRGIDGFMPKFMDLFTNSNSTVINISDTHKLYQIAESVKVTKDWFKNSIMYWLNTKMGWDCEESLDNVYTWDGCPNDDRRKMVIVKNRLDVPKRLQFDINDFIDRDSIDDKGTTVGEKINVFSIRDELR
jgi:hypothetical protein